MPHCICRFLRNHLCIEGFDVWLLTSSTAQEIEATHVSVSCLVFFEIGLNRLSAPKVPFSAVFSSSLAEPFRAPSRRRATSSGPRRNRAGSSGHFERPSGDVFARSRKRMQVQCFRAARPGRLSGHFERPSGAEQARCRKRRQVRCFRGKAELSRAQLNEALGRVGVQGLLRKV